MSDKKELIITTRDRVLRAWQNTTELVRDFENYSHEIQDKKEIADLFSEYAVQQGEQAAKLLEILHTLS